MHKSLSKLLNSFLKDNFTNLFFFLLMMVLLTLFICCLIFDFDVNSLLLGGNSPTSFVAFPAHFVTLPSPWQLGLDPVRLPEYFLLPSSVARNNPRFGIEVSSFPQFVFVLSAELHPVK